MVYLLYIYIYIYCISISIVYPLYLHHYSLSIHQPALGIPPQVAIALALAGSFEVAPATIQGFDANYEQLPSCGVVESRC